MTIIDTLQRQNADDWGQALDHLLSDIHPVDRTATRIWFAFHPLGLADAFAGTDDDAALVRKLVLMGRFRLADQIDASHRFLYGHRFWPEAKRAIGQYASGADAPDDLAALITTIAEAAASRAGVTVTLVMGIAAVGLMTLRQVGADAFDAASGDPSLDAAVTARTPERILSARARDDNQRLLGFLRGVHKRWTVTFDENRRDTVFPLINGQTLTGAAANDKRDYSSEPRCIVKEGPIPVQCRSAFCGTCWIGVLGGAEKLSNVEPLERERIREFGYIETDDSKPIVRLACQSVASGAVSIVIPPWNGIVGRFLRARSSVGTT
jgi:ferredoxin